MPSGACVIRYEGKRGVVYRIKFTDAAGRQIAETLGRKVDGWTEQRAKAELRERLVRVERKGWRRPAPLTFSAYAATWLEEAERRRQWTPSSATSYGYALRRIEPHLGHHRLAAVRPSHVAAFVDEALATYSPATVNLDVGVIYDIFATARREELVDSNPAENVERPKVPGRRWRILEPAEIAQVANAFEDEQARTIFLVLTRTGLRRHELRALRWRDVDFVEEVLRVRKSKSRAGERSIALSAALLEELWQHRRATPYAGDDEYVSRARAAAPILRTAGKPSSERRSASPASRGYLRPFHDLRHTALTNEAAAGSNAVALMSKAGHANMSTTKRYLHLAGTVFRDEAEALERRLGGSELSTEVSTDPAGSELT